MHFLELIKISFLRELTSESHFTMSNLMKRKRVVISVQEKLTAIKRLNKGVSLRSVAKNYCVGISTVSEWRKYRKKKKLNNGVVQRFSKCAPRSPRAPRKMRRGSAAAA
jgi:transposase